jgi:hypothetical protein
MSRQDDTNRLYELLSNLSARIGGPRLLRAANGTTGWPLRGVYFFFEPGEVRSNGEARIVRIGTHALRPTSKTTLWTRLSQHRGQVGGRNPGGGNHRGSIFRLHVGAALITRGDVAALSLEAWLAPEQPPAHRDAERIVERAVSDYIGQMPVLWVDVPTRGDGTSDRGVIEANSIALVSAAGGALDAASPAWLGRYAANVAVQSSGLWNVHHVTDTYTPRALDVLEQHVNRQLRTR